MVSGVYAFYDSINCGPTNEGDLRSDSEYVILTIQKIFAFPPGLMARKQMATPMPFNLSLLCQQGKFRHFTCAPRGFASCVHEDVRNIHFDLCWLSICPMG